MSTHPVFCEFNGQRQRIGTANQAEDGSFVIVLGGFLVVGAAETGGQRQAGTRPTSSGGGGMCFPPYGRNKGQPIAGAQMEQLLWYAGNAVKSINDPAKSRWREKESALLEALNAEIIAQGGQPVELEPAYGGGGGTNDGPDDTLPF